MKTAFLDRPAKALSLLIAVLAVVWSLQCALCQTVLGKDVVETVMWGAQWQWGSSETSAAFRLDRLSGRSRERIFGFCDVFCRAAVSGGRGVLCVSSGTAVPG